MLDAFVVSQPIDEFDTNYSAGDLSLREAIFLARIRGAGLILFDTALANGTISLATGRGQLSISSSVAILGPDAGPVTIDARGLSRAFYVESGQAVEMRNIIVTRGSSPSGGGIYVSDGATFLGDHVTLRNNTATQRGGGIFVATGGTLTLRESVITGSAAGLQGAGIFVDVEATATINRSTLFANTITGAAGDGGGVYSDGTLALSQATLSANTATRYGGGVAQGSTGSLSILNSTLAANTVPTAGAGGGIRGGGATVTVNNSIIAGNLRGTTPEDVDATLVAGSANNLVGSGAAGLTNDVNGNKLGTIASPVDAKLQPLADYGGAVPTMPPRFDSPAIDAGSNALATAAGLTVDAAGNSRLRDFDGDGQAVVDMGAFEASRVIVVDSLLDEAADTDGKTSLREAVAAAKLAAGLDTIQFATVTARRRLGHHPDHCRRDRAR